MSATSYGIVVSPVAQAANLRLIINAYYGDVLTANSLLGRLVAAGTAGLPPITHNFAGSYVDEDWKAAFQGATPPVPTGGWPLRDDGGALLLSEVDALNAWAAKRVYVATGEDVEVLPTEVREAVFGAMSLMLFDPGE